MMMMMPDDELRNLLEDYERECAENEKLRERLDRTSKDKDELFFRLDEERKQHASTVQGLSAEVGRHFFFFFSSPF